MRWIPRASQLHMLYGSRLELQSVLHWILCAHNQLTNQQRPSSSNLPRMWYPIYICICIYIEREQMVKLRNYVLINSYHAVFCRRWANRRNEWSYNMKYQHSELALRCNHAYQCMVLFYLFTGLLFAKKMRLCQYNLESTWYQDKQSPLSVYERFSATTWQYYTRYTSLNIQFAYDDGYT